MQSVLEEKNEKYICSITYFVHFYLEFHTIVDLIWQTLYKVSREKNRFILVSHTPIIRTKKKFGFLISKPNVLFCMPLKTRFSWVTCKISSCRPLHYSSATAPPDRISRSSPRGASADVRTAQQHEGVNDPGFSLLCYWVNYTSPHSRAPAVNWIKAPGTHMARRKLILFVGKKCMNTYTPVACIVL